MKSTSTQKKGHSRLCSCGTAEIQAELVEMGPLTLIPFIVAQPFDIVPRLRLWRHSGCCGEKAFLPNQVRNLWTTTPDHRQHSGLRLPKLRDSFAVCDLDTAPRLYRQKDMTPPRYGYFRTDRHESSRIRLRVGQRRYHAQIRRTRR